MRDERKAQLSPTLFDLEVPRMGRDRLVCGVGNTLALGHVWTGFPAPVRLAVPHAPRALHSARAAVPCGGVRESRAPSRARRLGRDQTPRFHEWKRWKATTPLSVGHGPP